MENLSIKFTLCIRMVDSVKCLEEFKGTLHGQTCLTNIYITVLDKLV